ncbi:hypothetical protein Athai_25260 [Actinocatenispora thailandica]|uniref:RNA polymerase sigma factor 70 region 4 type 2 domain-containing protein n=1 Tax=Actinocatenispora thailandica TaxID=227318 RepID=A0A7R7DNR3_9ACTN|nr:sigma-70 region 4 domain-containing protein [Actinocatenispora thailandica]BCJ35023.1 hypothetical protein Athai_25260 [Actinocatenispora thailandica]
MHPPETYEQAVQLRESGLSLTQIARALGLSPGTVAHWIYGSRARQAARLHAERRLRTCAGCTQDPSDLDDPDAYAYLLGQYLGDGHLVTSARVPVLRVSCANAYPDIIDECRQAMLKVRARSVSIVPKTGCVSVQSYSTHWPHLFPQHGPGPKHRRRILLVEWQQAVVCQQPRALLRGLIHSDGCRSINRVTVRGKQYAYPRYLFGNESADILGICAAALDRIGARWRFNRRNSISVATRDDVALLDEFIGPKT